MSESSTIFDVIIIGSGPSGLTAAVYVSRAFLKTLVIGGNPPGGQLAVTSDVENFPGFPEGIKGPELISRIRKQAEKFGAEFADENVVKISGSFEENFTLETDGGKIFKARAVIVATGSSAKWLGLESEQRLIGRGVSACATCDGFFFKDKVIAVVGGGDCALEEATFLARFASKVYVLVRKSESELKACKYLQKRAFDSSKIEFMFNTRVLEVLGENSVKGLRVERKVEKNGVETTEEIIMDDVRGLFVAIGHEPNTKFLSGFVELDEKGYVKVMEGSKTSKEGIFASGDVHDFRYRQAVSSAGFGCMAALDTIRFLEEHGIEAHVASYQ
jgi:thioredoxin reductase (NADPH)